MPQLELIDLPVEVFHCIWEFLREDVSTLCACSLVSKFFLELSSRNSIWKHLCMKKYKDKNTFLMHALHPLFTAPADRLKQLSIIELKDLIKNRDLFGLLNPRQRTDIRAPLEKSELVSIAAESFPAWLAHPLTITQNGKACDQAEAKWSSIWKKNYAVLVQESYRNFITFKEITSLEWRFNFVARFNPQFGRVPDFWGNFNSDFTYESNIFEDSHPDIPWIFIGPTEGQLMYQPQETGMDDNVFLGDFDEDDLSMLQRLNINQFWSEELSWLREEVFGVNGSNRRAPIHDGINRFAPSLFSRQRKVQVSHYPPLLAVRDPITWTWVLTNHFVIFRSKT
ncbi:hypothetical protein MP638_003047 [Amoeboaphelidium occidentale]|nr:hypothetical protein MP638_003047 [Amoeboaphelidium occidentale]